jgi:hypothetical protein
MKLITTFPLERYDISPFGQRRRPLASELAKSTTTDRSVDNGALARRLYETDLPNIPAKICHRWKTDQPLLAPAPIPATTENGGKRKGCIRNEIAESGTKVRHEGLMSDTLDNFFVPRLSSSTWAGTLRLG